MEQKPCIDCGNCVSGCNVGAKNTLYMNYLPMARNAGATILTQTKVEWLEKLAGRRLAHSREARQGRRRQRQVSRSTRARWCSPPASLNSTEILLRSEMHGLSVSPALGTKFSGNGDFFGLAYNGDYETDVLGYLHKQARRPAIRPRPARTSWALVRYTDGLPEAQRIAIEDFSFPSAYLDGAKAAFGLLRGQDTVTGNEDAQRARLARDFDPDRARRTIPTAP